MRVFRRVMLGGGIDIDALPDTQKLYYKATSKVIPLVNSLGAPLIVNKWDATTGEGIIICCSDITIISDSAFYNRPALTNVTIPDSVTSIGQRAFDSCTSLTSVTIGNGVTAIRNSAFSNCTSLTSVTIPDSVTLIEYYAFYGCSRLTAFYGKYASADNRCLIIDGVLSAFAPTDLTQYIIPEGVTSIGDYAFYKCSSLTSVTIPDSVTEIGEGALYGCSSLTSVTIPEGVTSIGERAFFDCDSLINITIPNNVTSITRETFRGCTSLTSVTIGNGVTSIGYYAFRYCNSMQYYDFSTHESVPKLFNTNSFNSIPSTCKIIVPDALYDEWIAATNWSTYASYIIKKSDWDASQTTK